MDSFPWPWQYNFPPFFTKQPNSATRSKQLEAWCSLVLDYYKSCREHRLDVTEAQGSPLFCNKKINRKVSPELLTAVLEALESRGNVEFTDPGRKQCLVMWRSPAEWGQMIYNWAKKSNLTSTVCTFYEIVEGEDTGSEEFHGIEEWLLIRSLKTLSVEGKAEVMGTEGVKFF